MARSQTHLFGLAVNTPQSATKNATSVCVCRYFRYIVALRYVHCLLHSFSELLAFLSSFPLGCAMFMELSARRTLPSIPHATALPFKSTHWRWMAFAVDRKYLGDVAVMRYASLALSTRDLFDCHIKCCSYPKWLYPFLLPIPSRIIGSIRDLWCHKKKFDSLELVQRWWCQQLYWFTKILLLLLFQISESLIRLHKLPLHFGSVPKSYVNECFLESHLITRFSYTFLRNFYSCFKA